MAQLDSSNMTVDGKDGLTRSPRRPRLSKEQILEHRLEQALHIITCRDIWDTKKSESVKLGFLRERQLATSYNHDAINKGSEHRAILNPDGPCASGFANNPSRGDLQIIDTHGKRTHSIEVKTQGAAQDLALKENAEKYRGMPKVVESDNLPKNPKGKDIDQKNIHTSINLHGVESEPLTSKEVLRRASCDWHKGVDGKVPLTDAEIAKKCGVSTKLLQDVQEQGLTGKLGELQKRIAQEVQDLGGKLPLLDPHYHGEQYRCRHSSPTMRHGCPPKTKYFEGRNGQGEQFVENRCQREDGKEKIEHTSVKKTQKGTKKTTYKNESQIDDPIGKSTFFMVAAWPALFYVNGSVHLQTPCGKMDKLLCCIDKTCFQSQWFVFLKPIAVNTPLC